MATPFIRFIATVVLRSNVNQVRTCVNPFEVIATISLETKSCRISYLKSMVKYDGT